MKKNIAVILVLLFIMIFISGCINILPTLEDDSIAPGKGRLKIYLTDSSEKYKANDTEVYLKVNITIYKIQVHLAGEDEEAEGEWIEWELKEKNEFDLIQLKNDGISELLLEKDLEPGKYTQLRLFVEKIIVEPNSINVEISNVYQTGIKLIHPFEINGDDNTVLTIDFDAEESIIKTGNGSYKLEPVIKIITG